MNKLPIIGLSLVILATAVPPVQAQKKVPNGAKVFLLSGGQRQHHGYRDQAFYLSRTLENTGRFQVTIGEDAAILETPAMRKYDLLIVAADRRDDESKFTRSQQEAIFEFVRSGHGYVSIHGADNAARDWLPEWRDMLGGVFSHVGQPDSKTKQATFKIKITRTDHPITRGVNDFELKDELYYQMQMMPDVQPLATVEYEGVAWPVAWTRTFGKGRVFHTNLGHTHWTDRPEDDPLRDPNLMRLIVQGMDWVVAGRTAEAKN